MRTVVLVSDGYHEHAYFLDVGEKEEAAAHVIDIAKAEGVPGLDYSQQIKITVIPLPSNSEWQKIGLPILATIPQPQPSETIQGGMYDG